MKRLTTRIVFCLLLMFSFPLTALAKNQVNTIEVEAVILENGSMHITQTWEGSFDQGTESYIPVNAPDYLTISNLMVTDQNGEYQTVADWNVDWSFQEKANKCGINYTDFGYEICFGISRYGQNRYTIEYVLDNVVGGYTDRDGVNFRFINDRMNTTPTDVKVTVRLANGTSITDEIADIWGFGFAGQVEFLDGAILAYTEAPINLENHVTVMFSLDKGILSPSRKVEDSFETVKQLAFADSDYEKNDSELYEEPSLLETLLGGAGLIAFWVWIITFIRKNSKKGRAKRLAQFSEQFGYFRDIPNEGNMSASYALGRLFEVCEDGAVLATGILRLIQLGCLSPISQEEVGFWGKTKEVVNLQIMGGRHSEMNEYDEYLYTVLESAAGADGILQAKELERFANQNDKLLRTYIEKNDRLGRAYLDQKRCLKRRGTPARLTDLTSTGEQELGELIGLKRYLEDFSLIAERGVKEVPIWRELLSYAMLFGIADKVAEQMKELYPSIAPEVAAYSQSMSTAYSYNYLLYSSMRKAEQRREQEKRSSGGGGFSSIGGGGGSIGGGSGGGTR